MLCCSDGIHTYDAWCFFSAPKTPSDEHPDALRRKLTGETLPSHREGEGDVTFVREGCLPNLTITNVDIDNIGDNLSGQHVVSCEKFDDGTIIHVPFVQSWTIEYRP